MQFFFLPTDASYDAVVKAFAEHFVHLVNEVYEWSRFYR